MYIVYCKVVFYTHLLYLFLLWQINTYLLTYRVWSKASYRLREIVENPGNRVMYYLLNGPERAFVSEELMLIPEDTELPPDYVQEW